MPRLCSSLGSLVIAASLFVASSGSAGASPATHEAAVKNFFKAAKMENLINQTLIQMTDVQIRANPAMSPYRETMLKFFQKYMSWSSLEPEITKLYVKEFTEQEINEITKFYETPVGQKVMRKLPELSAQGAAIGQTRVQSHINELTKMITDQQAKSGGGGSGQTAPSAPGAPGK